MHELTIRTRSVKGANTVPDDTEGSVLFVPEGELLVNGEVMEWYPAICDGVPISELEPHHWRALRDQEPGIRFVEAPSLAVGGGFVSLTIHYPLASTSERFGPDVHLQGSGPEALYLPIRSIRIEPLGP